MRTLSLVAIAAWMTLTAPAGVPPLPMIEFTMSALVVWLRS